MFISHRNEVSKYSGIFQDRFVIKIKYIHILFMYLLKKECNFPKTGTPYNTNFSDFCKEILKNETFFYNRKNIFYL